MERQTVIADAIRQLEAIGSEEVSRHIGVAINKVALRARDEMRQSARDTLGKRVSGPGALFAPDKVSDYTINAINATQSDFSDAVISADVYVNARQGKRGQDQSAFLKYLFGVGPQTRRAGDVGMSNDQIDIPQVEALILTQHMTGITSGGRQKKGLLAYLEAGAKRHGASRSDAMKQMGYDSRGARRVSQENSQTRYNDLQARLDRHRKLYGDTDLQRRLEAARARGSSVAKAVREHAKRRDLAGLYEWGVFKSPDPKSGLPSFKARPKKIRDPSGGYHVIRRRDGTSGRMPDMLTVAPEYGASGKGAGPRALTTARATTTYLPELQGAWDLMTERGAALLAEELAKEVAHAVERKQQGRSY